MSEDEGLVKNRVWIKVGGIKVGTGLIVEKGFFKKKIVSLDLFKEYRELLK